MSTLPVQTQDPITILLVTAANLDGWLAERAGQARVFAEINTCKTACQGRQLAEASSLLVAFHKLSPAYENLFLADTNGRIFLDSIGGKPVGIEVVKIPAYATNIQKAQQGALWIGEAERSPATGRPVCLIKDLSMFARTPNIK